MSPAELDAEILALVANPEALPSEELLCAAADWLPLRYANAASNFLNGSLRLRSERERRLLRAIHLEIFRGYLSRTS